MAVEEISIINASYDYWGVEKGTGKDGEIDWADTKALAIASDFLGIDGYENHGTEMEQFDWPSLCKIIAQALRKERG